MHARMLCAAHRSRWSEKPIRRTYPPRERNRLHDTLAAGHPPFASGARRQQNLRPRFDPQGTAKAPPHKGQKEGGREAGREWEGRNFPYPLLLLSAIISLFESAYHPRYSDRCRRFDFFYTPKTSPDATMADHSRFPCRKRACAARSRKPPSFYSST